MTTFEIPTLTTARLRLRAFRAGDLDAYAAMQANPEVMRYLLTGRTSTRAEVWRTMATSLGAWALRGYGMWAMELKETGEFVGRAGLHQPEGWPDLELGWMLLPSQRRHGYATEAARAALDYAFTHLHAPRLVSLIRIDNTASERVARRLGGRQATTIDFLGGATLVYVYHPPETVG